jgi:hypothetical protein
MAARKFLSLDNDEIAALRRLGNIVLSNYENKVCDEPEPTPAEFERLAAVFVRIKEL